MQIDGALQPTTIENVAPGDAVYLPQYPGVSLAVFAEIRDETRTALVLNPTPTDELPAAVGSMFKLQYSAREICYAISNAIIRPDVSSMQFASQGAPPVGSIVHALSGISILAAREERGRGMVCFNLASSTFERPSVDASSAFYGRWKIVVPSGNLAETVLFEFDASTLSAT